MIKRIKVAYIVMRYLGRIDYNTWGGWFTGSKKPPKTALSMCLQIAFLSNKDTINKILKSRKA